LNNFKAISILFEIITAISYCFEFKYVILKSIMVVIAVWAYNRFETTKIRNIFLQYYVIAFHLSKSSVN